MAAVVPWLGVSPAQAASAMSDAASQGRVRRPDAFTVRAVAAWFGAPAAQRFLSDDKQDLRAFADRHPPADTVHLLDAIVAVAAAGGGITRRNLRLVEVAGRQLLIDPVVIGAVVRRHDPRYAQGLPVQLAGDRFVIGSDPSCDIVLPDPQVLPRHAELVRVGAGWRLIDLGGTRPVLVNGKGVGSAPVDSNSTIRIGPCSLTLRDDALWIRSHRGFSTLAARGLKRVIRGNSALDDVRFTAVAGEVIAVVGPSGGGKTTLLTAIEGTAAADSGEVTLDHHPLPALLEARPTLAGHVPQDDLVLPELTAGETLQSAARLRFSMTPAQRAEAVERVLAELDIAHIRDSRIGDALRRGLSGGQRKRVNLGQELLGPDTRVLFLDEPTSGLDPQASQDILRLVRRLADNGRIVLIVTHDLSPEVVGQVDHLLVLAPGGRVAWFGPPAEACTWFGVATPDAIFHVLKDRTPQAWAELYRKSDAARMYEDARTSALELGFLGTADADASPPLARPTALSQLGTLLERYARQKWRDRTGLLVLAAQPPVLATCLGVLYPGVSPGTLFILTLSCMWFGMFAGVREFIADRVIWRRERKLGVGVAPYVASKVIVLAGITAVQCLMMVGLCWGLIDFAADGFSFPSLLSVCTLTGWAGMGLALVVGALWTSSEAAVGSLPILLVPQILFSSVLVSLRSMDKVSIGLSWITVQRYAIDAALKSGTHVEQAGRFDGKWEQRAVSGALYEMGLKPGAVEDLGVPLRTLMGGLGGWAVLFIGVAAALVWARDRPPRRRAGPGSDGVSG